MTTLVCGQEENMTDSDEPKFFAIKHANSGSISEINETTYSLELNDVSDKTILFSDRSDGIVTSIRTSDFIGNWAQAQIVGYVKARPISFFFIKSFFIKLCF